MAYSRGGASNIGGSQREKDTVKGRDRSIDKGKEAKGDGLGGLLDKVFGYENLGQRRQAYSNNPNAPGKGYDAMIASFPEASPGYIAGTMFDAMNFGPVSALSTIGNAAIAAARGTVPEGMGQRIAKEFGATRGPQGPDVPGGGRERGGQGGALRDPTLWNDVPTEAQQVTQPEQKTEDALTQFKKRQYALGLNGVPAPLGYRYGTAKWL